MTSLISHINTHGLNRVVLEHDEFVGIYVYAFETAAAVTPVPDYQQDDLEMAMLFCPEDLSVTRESWMPLTGSEVR